MALPDPVPVTVIGLGPMGGALAGALLDRGHPTTVWNRTPQRAEPLVARGAVRADNPAEAVAASPLTIACVINYEAVMTILDPAAESLKGRTLLNLTSDAPDQARAAADWAAGRGIDYLDGSIMTPVTTIGRPEAVYLLSGVEEVFRAHRATLADLGGTVTYVGAEPHLAAAYDVALLDIFWTAMSGVAHGFALAGAHGIAAGELLPFATGMIDVVDAVTRDLADAADHGIYSGDDSALTSNAAGMAHIIHAGETREIDTSVLAAAKAVVDRAIAAGHGDDDFARIIETLQRGRGNV